MLTPLTSDGGDLWVAECRVRIPFGFRLPTRMTVIRLPQDRLFLHSPVRLTPELKRALDEIGHCADVVAPNRFHHVFLSDYRHAYPDARYYAAPGLPEKKRDFSFDEVLTDSVPVAWAEEIEQVLIAGSRTMGEVAFYHKSSRSLLLTDIALNVGEESPLGLRLWAHANGIYGKLRPALPVRLSYSDRAAARASVARILQWDFQRVIVCHGKIIEGDAKDIVKTAFGWLDE